MFFTSAIFKTLVAEISVSATHSFTPTWPQVDFSEYALPGHYLKRKNHQALEPSNADINCNLESKWSRHTDYYLIHNLGLELDKKYKNFLKQYKLSTCLFENITDNKHYPNPNFEIFFIEENNGNKVKRLWDPENELFPLQVGEWKSYNLVFKNLLNNTSFSFSINFTNFDLKRGDDGKGEINFADFGKLPFLHQDYALYSSDYHTRSTNTLKVNLANKILNLANPEDWVAVDSFFLKPISCDYTAQVYEHDDGCDKRIKKRNKTGEWTWSNLEHFHVDVGIYIGVNKRCSVFDEECPPVPPPPPDPPDAPPKMYAELYTVHDHESNNTFVFKGVGQFWSNKYDWPYGHHPWHVIPFYHIDTLKTGYRDVVFQNKPYELSEAHGEAKKWLSNLTNRIFNCLLGNDDLSNKAVQKTIKTNFNEVNDHFFYDINRDSERRKIEIIKRDPSGARIDYHLVPYQYNHLKLSLLLLQLNSQWEIDIQVYYKPIA